MEEMNSFGNEGLWLFAILALFGFGGNGFFGGNRSADGAVATHADIDRSMQFSALRQGQADNAADIQRGIYEINGNTASYAYNNLGEIRDIGAAVNNIGATMQNCCCTTQRAIDGVNYNLATQSAAIQANSTANAQKILDAISGNRMADMQNQINQLQLQNAVAGVVRYPSASTYYAGSNPFCATQTCCAI